jgi:hypothetical protein
LEGDDTGVDVGGFEHVQQTHGENLLCGGDVGAIFDLPADPQRFTVRALKERPYE